MVILEEPIKQIFCVKNYIGGEWVESAGKTVNVVNPATCKVIATVPISTKQEIDSAVVAAEEAFPEWRTTPPIARARCLLRLRELIEKNFEELSRIQTMEHGKTIDESRGETRRGIENIEVAAGIPSLMMGYNLEDVSSGIDEYVIRQPLGVFGIIGPFNFPFMVPLWFAPYAVATGNCIVIKPSSEDPISQIKISELAEEAGFPPGVWNVVNGGREVVNGMLDNPHINGVCFVGSTPVGRDVIYRRCGETGKRVISQCGAKNFIVITPDANVNKAIAGCMTSFYGNAGQRCLAGSNLVISCDGLNENQAKEFHDKVTNRFVEMASSMKVGYGLDESVQMGPLRDAAKKEKTADYIQKGVDEGALLKLDGRKIRLAGDCPHDSFLNPTVFDDVAPDMTIGKEEIFGPVACLMSAKNLDEAIEMIHANPFGNSAAVFTSSGKTAREFRYKVKCGNIGINIGLVAPMAFFPFSGMKDSFFGVLHGQGQEATRFFTESKVVIERWF
ncbi:MAG: CoA-acylating methylmalonate-semialdehyde dehydrogenase [Candidatus Bathyarchaeia archaeon]|jgi:malonate-semialdehyde dehydrogenase (acetylating)/methylmalonate-semialdehyde dehydrogenase